MKHPALTRAMAVVLVILSLVMLLAGLGSLRSAADDRRRGQGDYQRLSDRIEEYNGLLSALDGSEPYAARKAQLDQDREAHEKQAVEHRVALATYTATRSGLQTGAAAMNDAEYAFYMGKAQYEAGVKEMEQQLAAFEEGYRQYEEGKRQLEEGRQMLALASELLGGLRRQMDQARQMGQILDSEDPEAAYALTLNAYDGALANLDTIMKLLDTLEAQDGIGAGQLELLKQLLAEQTELDLEDWELPAISGEQIRQWRDAIAQAAGMSLPELRETLQQERDRIAAHDGETLTEEQMTAIRALYDQNRQLIGAAMTRADELLTPYEQQVSQALEQMDAAQAELDAMAPMMEAGKQGLEQGKQMMEAAGEGLRQGENALYLGKLQLQEQQEKLKEQGIELRKEKRELDKEAVRLEAREREAEAQRLREQRETSVRLMLLDRQEIQDRVDRGETLSDAADAVARGLLEETERSYGMRVRIGALMVLGGILGFAVIPGAFEKIRSRLALLIPGLGCTLCAAGAEILCRLEGRGDSYSALAAGAAALLLLLAGMPREKRRVNSE